jgi:hypothetical protein
MTHEIDSLTIPSTDGVNFEIEQVGSIGEKSEGGDDIESLGGMRI